MAKKQLHVRIESNNYDRLKEMAIENNKSMSEVIDDFLSENIQNMDLKKSIRWTNDILEMIYEMTNYMTLEIEYRIGDQFRPRFTSEEKSRIIEQIEARRKQERGYLSGRDRHQE